MKLNKELIKSIWYSIYARFVLCIVIALAVYLMLLATLQAMVNQATPPEGFIFERLPVVTGIYDCCGSSKYPSSTVGTSSLDCSEPDFINGLGSYHKYGNSRFSCGLQDELNGKMVEVTQVMTPTIRFLTPGPVVLKIVSNGQVFYEHDDKKLREQWIEASNDSIVNFAQMIFMYLFLILLFTLANPKKLLEKMYG